MLLIVVDEIRRGCRERASGGLLADGKATSRTTIEQLATREGDTVTRRRTTLHRIVNCVGRCAARRPVTGTDHRAGYTGILLKDAHPDLGDSR